MELSVQIQSFVVSFVFGFLFSYVVNIFYQYLFKGKICVQIFWNFVLVLGSSLLYFYILKVINHAVIHLYFLAMVVIGYLCGNLFSYKVRKE
ncbi:MAG: hypothetical protein PUB18_00795 [bacterium]|nr:hypothetical protein [bacterium]